MRYVFIINPTAGKGTAQEIIVSQIKEYFGERKDFKIYITEYSGQATEIARSEAQTGENIYFYACGGEGTAFEIINGIVDYPNAAMGVIPCGSANDFLKFYGHKEMFFDIGKSVEGREIIVDLIKADDVYCVNQCSVGIDANIAEDMQMFKKWPLVSGKMAYNLSVIRNFLRKKITATLNITIDGKKLGTRECLFAVCANGPVYGGGYISAPHANPSDEKLDFTIIDSMPRFKIPKFIDKYAKGEQEQYDYCTTGNCSVMEIESEEPFLINLDGEITSKKKVRFEIVRRALRFVVPTEIAENIPKEMVKIK